ncbi:hypothetical protein BOO30_15400 [Vibrio navarrensis]|uniref:AsmA family protein n=1 Tax=Vibrio navarrensis TaxID=29495 RepID=UPI001869E7C3|nr:AsmA family protein [Vibrio navarrensis]MBE4577958.1 hypothetical protein [Vibrio navarrensis]MBE4597762.1 hypothetical protein [Vibrio navarrensis]
MKKIIITITVLLLVVAIIPIALLFSLQTRYASQVFNQLNQWLHSGVSASEVRYQFPYHFSFKNLTFDHPDVSYVEQLDLWFNPSLYRDGQWQLDSVLIDGLSLQQGLSSNPQTWLRDAVDIQQIALSHFDYADKEFSARGLKVQLKQPYWETTEQWLPYAEIQLSADQIYWQGEAFNKTLLDMDYRPQESTVFGLSFLWRGGHISGQAEQYAQGWSLVNVTIDGLTLSEQQVQSIVAKPWTRLGNISHINSLDVMRSSIDYQGYQLINVELSCENLTLPFAWWQQNNGLFSLSAESVQDRHNMWIEPRLSLRLNPAQIDVEEAAFLWQQGNVSFSGRITPHALALKHVNVNNVKWAAEQPGEGEWLKQLLRQAKEISVGTLNIERSQFIQLIREPYWQLTGLNIEGQNLLIKQDGQLGLWQGTLSASAANASYQSVLSSHPIIEMHSDQGKWQMDRLFAPLQQGYVEGQASLDLTQISKPWQLTLNADGFPAGLLLSQLPLPLEINAISSIDLQAEGLAGDWAMFSHTLSGGVYAQLHEAYIQAQDNSITPLMLSELRLDMQRGKLSLSPINVSGPSITGNISGQADLAADAPQGISYQFIIGCQQLSGDLLSDQHQRHSECDAALSSESQPPSENQPTLATLTQ